jgi:hypothetical protein
MAHFIRMDKIGVKGLCMPKQVLGSMHYTVTHPAAAHWCKDHGTIQIEWS